MKTLPDGTQLPSHSEFYLLWPEIQQAAFRALFEEKKKELESTKLFQITNWDCHSKFEVGGWDIMLYMGSADKHGRGHYEIEYKSNVNEWHKSIPQFMAQINKRIARQDSRINDACFGVVLMTFDVRFREYEQILAMNNVRLMVLPQVSLSLRTWNSDVAGTLQPFLDKVPQ